ncbi:MAG: HPr family phosphocarrier protein [candidate division Zixibacteria bacterium]|nr:HPr family phosphocarrier protein [candidate division Zixibacteria bacterium]
MIEKEITVINKLGLHARPAAQLVKTISRFKSEVSIKRDSLTVNAKSIMGVMMLAAELGAVLKFQIEGEDERQAMDAIEKVFQDKFGED